MWRILIIGVLLYGFVTEFGTSEGWALALFLVAYVAWIFFADLRKKQNETLAQGGLQRRFPNFVTSCIMQSANYAKDNGRVLVFSHFFPLQGITISFVLEGGFAYSVRAELRVLATKQVVTSRYRQFDGRDQPVHVYTAWTQALMEEVLTDPRTLNALPDS